MYPTLTWVFTRIIKFNLSFFGYYFYFWIITCFTFSLPMPTTVHSISLNLILSRYHLFFIPPPSILFQPSPSICVCFFVIGLLILAQSHNHSEKWPITVTASTLPSTAVPDPVFSRDVNHQLGPLRADQQPLRLAPLTTTCPLHFWPLLRHMNKCPCRTIVSAVGRFSSSSEKVRPNWISFNMSSMLSFKVW